MTPDRVDPWVLTSETLNSRFAEAYRALRANIGFSNVDEPIKTIAVISAANGEGKTTTAVNLGIIMAQMGLRVLLADADFRRPALPNLLGLSSDGRQFSVGLSNVIIGRATSDEAIVPTAFARLSLMPSGPLPPNPSELIASKRMRNLIEDLRQHADIVIFDSPPCFVYSDAMLLASLVDGVLYVVSAGSQNRSVQRRVVKQLRQAKAHMLGVVFNRAELDGVTETHGDYHPGRRLHWLEGRYKDRERTMRNLEPTPGPDA